MVSFRERAAGTGPWFLRVPMGNNESVVLRVGLVEDDSLLRATLTGALDARDDVEVVVSSPTGSSLMARLADTELDVIVVDVHLGSGPNGFDVAAMARRVRPSIGVLFLSSIKDPRLLGYNPESLPQGAQYVLKSQVTDISELVQCMREAHERAGDLRGPSLPKSPFTPTQLEILRLVAEGKSNATIAKERFVSERAVEMAVSRLAKHLGLKENPGVNQRVHIAATFFREMGWVL